MSNNNAQPKHDPVQCTSCQEPLRLGYYKAMNYWFGTCDNQNCVLANCTLDIDDPEELQNQISKIKSPKHSSK